MFDSDSTHVICENCGNAYEHDELRDELEPHGEEIAVCPHCRHDDFISATECADCGEVYACDDMHEGLCWDCAENLKASVRGVLANAFVAAEWAAIEAVMEGESLFPDGLNSSHRI